MLLVSQNIFIRFKTNTDIIYEMAPHTINYDSTCFCKIRCNDLNIKMLILDIQLIWLEGNRGRQINALIQWYTLSYVSL